MTNRHDLDLALDALTDVERRALCSAAAEARDRQLADDAPRLAAVWHSIADAAAASRDRERAAFRQWQTEVDGGIVTFGEDS